MRKVLFICVAVALSIGDAHTQTNANEVLAKVASVYGTCQKYTDEGTISTGLSGFKETYFRTTFVRPTTFAFELWLNRGTRDRDHAWIVWKNGDVVKSWTPPNMFTGFNEKDDPLDTTLARLSSPSAGASLVVPPLLLPSLFRSADVLTLINDPRITGEEKINGRQTFRVEGTLLGQPIKLWVDKTEYLILKSSRQVILGNRQVESTIQYKAKLNPEIPPEDLIFRPPATKVVSSSAAPTSVTSPPSPPVLRPRLRAFGSSLGRNPADKGSRANARPATDDDVVRVDTDMVVSAVLVVDPQGKIVTGLTKEDFIVTEDDNLQQVASFSLGDSKDLPRSIVLIIDYSGSQLPYIRNSIESAKMLVDKLNPKDRMAVVTDDVKLLTDFTSDKALLKSQLESLKTSALSGALGMSDQYDALMASLNELFDNEDVRPIIIFQTDGDELDLLKGGTPQNPYALPRKYGFEDILTSTERTRATIYSVISGVQFAGMPDTELPKRAKSDWLNREAANMELMRARNFPVRQTNRDLPSDDTLMRYGSQWLRRQTALVNVAKFTGAWAEFLEEPNQADEIYTRVLTDIDRRYVIGYYPTNRARDGKRRKVHVEVRNHPEYLVWGQKSYFAREEK